MDELIVLENPVAIYTENRVDEILEKITKAAKSVVVDVSTAAGRKECASVANKVARTKVFLDSTGKELVSDWKEKAKIVDADRKKIRDTLDELKATVRAPLTEYERVQQEKEEAFNGMMNLLNNLAKGLDQHSNPLDEHTVIHWINGIDEKVVDASKIVGENARQSELADAHERAKEMMADISTRLKKQKEEREELERLRAEKEQREREEAERKQREVIERQAREKAEREAQEKIEAERREAKEREERMNREREEGIRRKQEEAERKELAEKAEKERLEADQAHRAAIMNQAYQSMIRYVKIDEQIAIEVIRAIEAGKINNVSIRFW